LSEKNETSSWPRRESPESGSDLRALLSELQCRARAETEGENAHLPVEREHEHAESGDGRRQDYKRDDDHRVFRGSILLQFVAGDRDACERHEAEGTDEKEGDRPLS
jgi:hypothetical protein